jgi:hypothetical protein
MEKELELQNKKLELIQWLSTIEDINFLEKISELIIKEKKKDWWDNASEDEKSKIEIGINQANTGQLNEHHKARAIYAKWL